MNNLPLVTIGCLCFNTGIYVVEALESIINSDYNNLEIIVIDDCSTDRNSVVILEEYLSKNTNITYFKNKKNEGIIYNLNRILNLSKGKYIAFVSDDLISKEKLNDDVKLFENLDNSYILVHSIAKTIDEYSNIYEEVSPDINESLLYKDQLSIEEMIQNPLIHATTVLFKTENVKQLGGWDSTLLFEDKPFWFKLSSNNYKIKFRPQVSSFYRRHNKNVSSIKSYGFWIYQFDLYRRYSDLPVARDKLIQFLKLAFGSVDYDECLKIYKNSVKYNQYEYLKWKLLSKIGGSYIKNLKLNIIKFIKYTYSHFDLIF
jgi:glycosyltransferase involved in cell wall biosynthesis